MALIRHIFYLTYCSFRGVNYSNYMKNVRYFYVLYFFIMIFFYFDFSDNFLIFKWSLEILHNFLFRISSDFQLFLWMIFLTLFLIFVIVFKQTTGDFFKWFIPQYFWADNEKSDQLHFPGYWHAQKLVERNQEK